MATRVIENRRDRLATILVAPLMSCSARLPVYILLIGAFLREGRPAWVPGLVLFAMYMLGFTIAPLVALLLKRTLLKGETPVFVMELPAYKRPTWRGVSRRMFDAGYAFLRRAGTVILACMVIIWALMYFPYSDASGTPYDERIAAAEEKAKDADEKVKELKDAGQEVPVDLEVTVTEPARLNGEWKRNSVMGRVGRALEPAFTPLGWDWRIGMAAIASFPAREVIVGMLGMVYDVGDEDDEEHPGLQEAFRREWANDPVRGPYAVPVALSIMVFIALCLQCASTLAVIRRETRSWAWPAFTFAYMTTFAYAGAFLTFQIGRLIVDAVG
jgi:ferrous iron transport protein B